MKEEEQEREEITAAAGCLPLSSCLSLSSSREEIEEEDHELFPTIIEDEPSSSSLTSPHHEGLWSQPPLSCDTYNEKKKGNAVDIIVVRSKISSSSSPSSSPSSSSSRPMYYSTDWKACFSWSMFRSYVSAGVGDVITIKCNGHLIDATMQMKERGRCTFLDGTKVLSSEQLAKLFRDAPPDQTVFPIRYEHFRQGITRYIDARLYLWDSDDAIVVADLDGTLTRSDVQGHIRTLRLGQYDYLHPGACAFFSKLHQVGCRIVYLTARPIDWADASRVHLDKAKQALHGFPPGPVITNSLGITGALVTEVLYKNPQVFKTQILTELSLNMIHAGRESPHPIFVAGFGNRPTDMEAYQAVGMARDTMFLIDKESHLSVFDPFASFDSYDDPEALVYLLPKLKRTMPLDWVEKIDQFTAREIVLADERQEQRLAFFQAQRIRDMEEEQYFEA